MESILKQVTPSFKPWPKGVASFACNANMLTQTCVGWPKGIASRRKLDASHLKAVSVQPCSRAQTSENDTATDLRQLALGGQTVKNQLACEFECDQSDRKLSQVNASRDQTESHVPTSFQLAITCHFVWPGLKNNSN